MGNRPQRSGENYRKAIGKADQFNLDLVDTGWTDQQLCRWLERKARQQDITQPVLLEFVRRALAYLIEKRTFPHCSCPLEVYTGEGYRAEDRSLPPTGKR